MSPKETGVVLERKAKRSKATETASFDEDVNRVVYFVLENLPEKPFIKKMAEEKRQKTFTIGDKKWSLKVIADEAVISSGKIGEIKQIILTNKNSDGTDSSFGLFAEGDFGLVLGAYLGDHMFIRFQEPIDLAKTMKEIRETEKKRIEESLVITHNPITTAVQLNLRRDRVYRIASRLQKH